MTTFDARMRTARILWIAFLLHAGVLIFVAEIARKPSADPLDTLYLPFLVVSVICAFLSVLFPRLRQMEDLSSQLQQQPDNAVFANKWYATHIVSLALAEVALLFGFVIRIMGVDLARSSVLYGIGIVALLLGAPRGK